MGTTLPTTILPGQADIADRGVLSPTIDDLSPYTGTWEEEQVVHLLKRCLFGAKKQDLDHFKSLTMTQAVNEILQPTPPPAEPPLNNYSIDGYTDPSGVVLWQTWINSGIALADKDLNEKRIDSFKIWWLGRLLTSTRSIHEKLTVFWHNHFATNTSTASDKIKARFWYDHYLTLRQFALGNFKSMAKAITIDPAMLYFLNGESNINTSPNENYARELQELYTAGNGPGSMYTEDDVRYAARILTGHTVSNTAFTYYFDAGKHDTGNKEFSNFYSNTVITGYSGAAGAGELDSLHVYFNDSLQLSLGRDTTLCRGETYTITPVTNASTYTWQDGNQFATYTPTQSGTYSVMAKSGCGADTATVEILFEDCPCALLLPNAFTPNGDGRNDNFRPLHACDMEQYTMRIFNRYGEMIYQSKDPLQAWNGRKSGKPVPNGACVWTVDYIKTSNQQAVSKKGTVLVLN